MTATNPSTEPIRYRIPVDLYCSTKGGEPIDLQEIAAVLKENGTWFDAIEALDNDDTGDEGWMFVQVDLTGDSAVAFAGSGEFWLETPDAEFSSPER